MVIILTVGAAEKGWGNTGDCGDDVPREVLDRKLLYLRDLLALMMDPDFVKD